MTCSCGEGTVWFDHTKGKWRSSDHRCIKPMPKPIR